MKACLVTIILMISFNILANADNFQFYYKSGGNSIYASYQSIKLYAGNSLVFSGYTDKFGRIAIKLRPGNYACTIMYQKKEYKITLNLDNRSDFKMVYFSSTIKPYLIKKV